MKKFSWALGLTLFLSTHAFAVVDFTAAIYEPDSSRNAPAPFRLERDRTESGGKTVLRARFTSHKGDLLYDEETTLLGDRLQKVWYERPAEHEGGFVEVRGKTVHFSYHKNGKVKEDDEKFTDQFVTGPTILDYLDKNWDALVKGKDVDFRFAVIELQETVGFKFFRVKEFTSPDGRKLMVAKMKPTSFFIAAIVNPLYFTFDLETHHLVSVKGRMTPHHLHNGKWEAFEGEAIYSYPAATPVKQKRQGA